LVKSDRQSLLILGDVAVHPIQLTDPNVPYVYEEDPERARRTRAAVLESVAETEMLVAISHFPAGGFGHIRRAEHGYRFEPVEIAKPDAGLSLALDLRRGLS
jgi:glyoxylase-like metal-dependent hydrolase (beta-lactamase superfamily II)